jgi:hypothetical protein
LIKNKDFDSDPENLLISYSKNGLDLGVAFTVSKRAVSEHVNSYGGKAIFYPHVLSKNFVFEMNFGQRVSLIGDEPFAPVKSGFQLVQKLPLDMRVCRQTEESRSTNKKDYEVVMVIGLPGVGKTRWAMEHVRKNPDKSFFVIGVASILDKMVV